MRDLGYIVDSTINLTEEIIKKYDISVVNLSLSIDGEIKEGININADVVEAIHQGKDVKTSQPSTQSFLSTFEELFKKGYKKIVVFTLASCLSGTYNGAKTAAKMLTNASDDLVTVIDTGSVSCGSGFVVRKFIENYENNNNLEQSLKDIKKIIEDGKIYFVVDDLKTLNKNGRLKLIKYIVAKILQLNPVLSFQNNVLKLEKSTLIGYQRVKKFLFSQLNLYYQNVKSNNLNIIICDVLSKEKAMQLVQEIKTIFPNANVEYGGEIPSVITTHIGPGGLGIYVNY